MDIQEIVRHLQDKGCVIARSQVNQKGRMGCFRHQVLVKRA